MGTYDQVNKIKDKYEKLLALKQKEYDEILVKYNKLKEEHEKLRKEMYDAGLGKGKVNSLKKELHATEVEKKTLENQLKELSGEKMLSIFSEERRKLIKRIRGLHFENKIFNLLAKKFQNGLDDVIEIAYRIEMKMADDFDYYTFVFRDNIVSLLEKILYIATDKKANSAKIYLEKLANGDFCFRPEFTKAVPNLKKKTVLSNMRDLINLQTTAYHGSGKNLKTQIFGDDSQAIVKANKFLVLKKDDQLTAIFALLEFMYFFFSSKDYEENLITLSSHWMKTIS